MILACIKVPFLLPAAQDQAVWPQTSFRKMCGKGHTTYRALSLFPSQVTDLPGKGGFPMASAHVTR